jgi:hypothetical protein
MTKLLDFVSRFFKRAIFVPAPNYANGGILLRFLLTSAGFYANLRKACGSLHTPVSARYLRQLK